jgi:hypothetical protein
VEPTPSITPVLCFVDGEMPMFRRAAEFEGVRLETDRSIERVLIEDGDLGP